VELDYLAAGRLPDSLARRWDDLCVSGSRVPLEEVASVLGAMNSAQFQTLLERSGPFQLHQLSLEQLRPYAVLNPSQREAAGRPEAMPFSELVQHQRLAICRYARLMSRPWITEEELDDAVLRAVPRKLASGEDGMSFMIEYQLPKGSVDQDVFFTAPLQVRLR
jgi:hypothetical protein